MLATIMARSAASQPTFLLVRLGGVLFLLLGLSMLLSPAAAADWWLIKGTALAMLLVGWSNLRAARPSVPLNWLLGGYMLLAALALLLSNPDDLPPESASLMQWGMMPLVLLVVGLLMLGNGVAVVRHWRHRPWW